MQRQQLAIAILRRDAVERLTGLSTTGLYRLIRDNEFPRPVRVSSRRVGWHQSEVEAWIESRPRAKGEAAKAA